MVVGREDPKLEEEIIETSGRKQRSELSVKDSPPREEIIITEKK